MEEREVLPTPEGQEGYSVVELVAAVTIFALVFAAVSLGIGRALDVTRNNRNRTTAAYLAASELEGVRSTSFDQVALGQTVCSYQTPSPTCSVPSPYTVTRDVSWVAPTATSSAMKRQGQEAALQPELPTVTHEGTKAGVILGTAAYMAPEQARGKAVDKRADIWAFGVVFYEMITGRRAFDGDDLSTIIAAVIRAEPSWDGVPAPRAAPPRKLPREGSAQAVARYRRCLETARHRPAALPPRRRGVAAGMDCRRRNRDRHHAVRRGRHGARRRRGPRNRSSQTSGLSRLIGYRIRSVAPGRQGATTENTQSIRRRQPASRDAPPEVGAESAETGHDDSGSDVSLLPVAAPTFSSLIISPDATRLVFVGSVSGGTPRLFTRKLEDAKVTELGGTQGATHPFFFSGRPWVTLFSSRGKLAKAPVEGGAVVPLADLLPMTGGPATP